MKYDNSSSLASSPTVADSTLVQLAAYRERRELSAEISAALLGAEITELTREELFVLAPVPHQAPFPFEVLNDLRARKVRVRVLYTGGPQPPADPVATLACIGIALPTPLHLPYFLVVRDRAVVYLPNQHPSHATADRLTRVRSAVMGDCMATAFIMMWETAVQRARAAQIGDRFDGAEDLIRVLSDGVTDDRAAVMLHMSRRTFARRVADMMHRLDANTRFQAGVRAARRGWV